MLMLNYTLHVSALYTLHTVSALWFLYVYGYACEGIIEFYRNQWHEVVHSFNAYSRSQEHPLIRRMSSSESELFGLNYIYIYS